MSPALSECTKRKKFSVLYTACLYWKRRKGFLERNFGRDGIIESDAGEREERTKKTILKKKRGRTGSKRVRIRLVPANGSAGHVTRSRRRIVPAGPTTTSAWDRPAVTERLRSKRFFFVFSLLLSLLLLICYIYFQCYASRRDINTRAISDRSSEHRQSAARTSEAHTHTHRVTIPRRSYFFRGLSGIARRVTRRHFEVDTNKTKCSVCWWVRSFHPLSACTGPYLGAGTADYERPVKFLDTAPRRVRHFFSVREFPKYRFHRSLEMTPARWHVRFAFFNFYF